MIDKNIRVNNEFYTAPVYNQFIQDFKLILHYPIAEMFQLGTPEEFNQNKNKALEFLEKRKPIISKIGLSGENTDSLSLV